jgi:hypothetical protein
VALLGGIQLPYRLLHLGDDEGDKYFSNLDSPVHSGFGVWRTEASDTRSREPKTEKASKAPEKSPERVQKETELQRTRKPQQGTQKPQQSPQEAAQTPPPQKDHQRERRPGAKASVR